MFTFPHKYIEIKLEKENKEGKEFDLNEAIKVINMIERVVDDSMLKALHLHHYRNSQ